HKRKFQCTECNRSFAFEGQLSQHLLIHVPGTQFHCTECNLCFSSQKALTVHERVHAVDWPLHCSACNRTFLDTAAFDQHQLSHAPGQVCRCVECSVYFTDPAALAEHKRMHSEDWPFRCAQCDRTFVHEGLLLEHLQNHSRTRSRRCHICGSWLSYKGLLKHTGAQLYHCKKCNTSCQVQGSDSVTMSVKNAKKPGKGCGSMAEAQWTNITEQKLTKASAINEAHFIAILLIDKQITFFLHFSISRRSICYINKQASASSASTSIWIPTEADSVFTAVRPKGPPRALGRQKRPLSSREHHLPAQEPTAAAAPRPLHPGRCRRQHSPGRSSLRSQQGRQKCWNDRCGRSLHGAATLSAASIGPLASATAAAVSAVTAVSAAAATSAAAASPIGETVAVVGASAEAAVTAAASAAPVNASRRLRRQKGCRHCCCPSRHGLRSH
ncbi:hypothetical protein E2320_022957, partial [Naja naja]